MTVVNPKSISGINSITMASGSDNLLTIHTNNGTERLRIDSTGATKIVTGIVTTLTATTGIVTTLTANTVTSLGAVSGTSGTFTGGIDVTSNVTISDSIVHSGDTDSKIRFPAADTITAETGGNERLRIGSTGLVGINTSSPSHNLDIVSSSNPYIKLLRSGYNPVYIGNAAGEGVIETIGATFIKTGGSERIRIQGNGAVGLNSTAPQTAFDVLNQGQTGITDVMLVKNFSAGNSFIRFQDNDGTSNFSLGADDGSGLGANAFILYDRVNGAYRMGVDNSGNMKLNSGNLVIGTSGKGIDFSATPDNAGGITSEVLDYYEEGTFTFTDQSSDTVSLTANSQAYYTRIGRFVHCQLDVTFSVSGSPSAYVTLNIPYTILGRFGGAVGWTDLGRPAFFYGSGTVVYLMDNNATGVGKHIYNNEANGKRFIGSFTFITS